MWQEFIKSFEEFQNSIIDQSPEIAVGILMLIVFTFLGVFLRSVTQKRLARRVEDRLLVNFVGRMIFLVFLIGGITIFLNQIGLGKTASGLLAGAGVSAIILGFAFKDIGENFLAGFFLAFSRPFGTGDYIEVEGLTGIVKALNFRNTHIRTFEGKDIFIPNAMLIKNPLINYTRDGLLRHDFVIGIDYGNDILEARRLILKSIQADQRIEQGNDLEPFMLLEEFGTSTVNIRVFYWINSYNFTGQIARLKTEVMNSILLNLTKNGFSLPADIVELKIYQEGKPIPVQLMKN
jgi:small-conductance mechanosensitive channel